MPSLRFCMVTTFYPPYAFGGDGIAVARLAASLAGQGHEVEVVHCLDSYRALAREPTRETPTRIPGVTVHALRSGVGPLSPLATHQTGFPVFKRRQLRRILDRRRFDVIHFHNISLVGGPGILRYGTGVKLYTLHEHWLLCPTHVLFRFRREPCERPSCLRCTLAHRRPPQLWRYTPLLKSAVRHVDAFIAPSEFTRRRHLAAGLDRPIVCIPPGLGPDDPGGRGPGPAGAAPALPARPFFLFVGRLDRLKGLQTVIPLFQGPGEADLVVAGDGGDAGELRRLAAGSDRIRFLGPVPGAVLPAVYARALALLVPSVGYETFAQVIIEAYAAGTPVIARALGPLPELVTGTGGGLTFRDAGELQQAMDRIRTEPELRARLAAAGHAAYRARFTAAAHLERYLGLIETLRAGRPARAPAAGFA